MKLQPQPNDASCVATAFAMVAGVEVQKVFDFCNHDGTQIIYPPPVYYRGFTVNDLMPFMWHYGFSCTSFYREYIASPPNVTQLFNYGVSLEYMTSLLKGNVGVICGLTPSRERSHAVAWDGEKAYCSSNGGRILSSPPVSLDVFIICERRNGFRYTEEQPGQHQRLHCTPHDYR